MSRIRFDYFTGFRGYFCNRIRIIEIVRTSL